jgi:hypothetical protein
LAEIFETKQNHRLCKWALIHEKLNFLRNPDSIKKKSLKFCQNFYSLSSLLITKINKLFGHFTKACLYENTAILHQYPPGKPSHT